MELQELEKMYMKVSDVARHFNIQNQSVRTWVLTGKVRCRTVFGLQLIPVEDVKRMEKERGRVRQA